MNKIFLIIQREYLTRVKKKAFIVMTFLVPALFIGMYALIGYLIVNKDDFADVKKVSVVDDSGDFKNKLKNTVTVTFHYSAQAFAAEKDSFKNAKDDYLLHVPADKKNVLLLGKKKPSIESVSEIEDQLNAINKTKRLLASGIDTAVVNAKTDNVDVNAKQLTDDGEKDAGEYLAYGIGFVSAFLIYMSLFIYGVQVMRGVIEEKTSRIIEVVISSVKPFQLMLGKIIGVGMVGLTQFVLWILLTAGLATGAGFLFVKSSDIEKVKTEQATMRNGQMGAAQQPHVKAESPGKGQAILESLKTVPWAYTLSVFLFYFLFGFMLYSSVFAAVGSAVDSETETQQFMLPITMPLIFTFIISINFVINNPDSHLAFWLSVIPFTAPIAMMIRVPFGVPAWELAVSMISMVAGFLIITWVASRIYRVGILMYGKKASYKELVKWFSYKE